MEAIPLDVIASRRTCQASEEVILAHTELNIFRTHYHRESTAKPADMILIVDSASRLMTPNPKPCYWHNLVVHHTTVLHGVSRDVDGRRGEVLYVCGDMGALSAIHTLAREQYMSHNIAHAQNFSILMSLMWTAVRIGRHAAGWRFEFLV